MPLDHLPGTFFGPSNLIDLVRHRVRHQPGDAAFTYLVDGEEEQVDLTYLELDRRARGKIRAWLQSLGLVGERALLLYPPGLEFIEAFCGCLYAGVVAVPVYPPRRNRSMGRIEAVADDAKAKVALTTNVVLKRVESLIDETPHLKDLTWLATCNVPEGVDQQWEMPDVHGDTISFLQYTSGSTGTPKGVMVNHANMLHNSALISYAFEHTRSGSGVFWLPSYHDMGLIGGILQPLYLGRPNILMSPMAFLQKPVRWLAAISKFRCTTSGGPNFAYDLCVRRVTPEQRETLDLSNWRVAFNGAEPIRAETLERFAKAFEPCGFRPEAFYPCYGMAEATLIVSGGQVGEPPVISSFDVKALSRGRGVEVEPDAPNSRKLVGSGGALPDQRIEIVDPDELIRCPDGQIGEIWVNSPSVAQGYRNKPEANDAVFKARLKRSGEGPFLRTGDLGFVQDGELFVTGRIKDLIILHGVNYYPQDIELTVQRAHRRLRRDGGEAFSIEGEDREYLCLVQELERRKQGDLDAIFEAIRRAVGAEHEVSVDAIVLIRAGSIPKTSSGKVQRHACRNGYLDGSLDVVGQWQAAGVKATAVDNSHEAKRSAKTPPDPAKPAAASTPGAPPTAAAVPDNGRKQKATPPSPKAELPRDAEIPPEYYQIDKFPEYVQLKQNLDSLASTGMQNPFFTAHQGLSNDRTTVEGRELINFAGHNYLGMSGDPVVVEATKRAIDEYGTSVSASRIIAGEKDLHGEFERQIARFMDTEATVVMVGGHATNETVIGHMLGPGDLILHDELSHNSIVQGCILSGARRLPFAHNDWEAAEKILDTYRHEYRRVLLAVEGIYGMDGDIPDIAKFIDVKKRHKALLMIDEAYSIGTLGATGHGIREYCGVEADDVDIWMSTLSKTFGSCGGFIAGYRCSGRIFEVYGAGICFQRAGLSPPNAAAALAALRLLEAEPQRVERLQENAQLFLDLARQRGLNTGMSKNSPVVPIIIGNSLDCLRLCSAMATRGVNVQPVLHPAVEESAARLRFFISSQHTDQQIRHTVDALAEEMEKIDPKYIAQTTSSG